ncbi:hypothetical protein C1H57_08230 [Clostridium sp. 2-1]|uniref:hypothetical protein n=1 Tax=Clostridium TaxID=1485 RepID=UPI000CDB2BDE|nr:MULTISPECIES: hypothetical protein [Clostridium]MBN7575393.1 hypothetical protein [Clostridium beijerinckii]MBN7580704.1 hypothetical protein [Clostridium beijerinckii]MBN7585157.1 hypothetical protein [Clostridium beijerinckii]MBO0522513.1 hypothetical protein [Clostridium beijerinckii]POO91799.1 hypothetical protein C1H57_08230 [Clostridium sp. 2-1]
MNLLSDESVNSRIEKISETKRVHLSGKTEVMAVYRIPLDLLYYNDQNDRIAARMSQYREENGFMPTDKLERGEFNDIIEEFIVETNEKAITRTQNNIKLRSQENPGVVLSDGRIIDGNRRFTCLRRLAKENPDFSYFNATILDRSIRHNAKEIKMLELQLQFGEESKEDYSSIDKITGIYYDVIKNKLLSAEEYAHSVNETTKSINCKIEIANLVEEFLEFINAKEQFHLARQLEVYAAIEELQKMLKKCMNDDDREQLKYIVFATIAVGTEEDKRNKVRQMSRIVSSQYCDEFIAEQAVLVEKVADALPHQKISSMSTIIDIRKKSKDIAEELDRSLKKADLKTKKSNAKLELIRLAENATDNLESIDTNLLKKMNDSELQRFERQIKLLEDALNIIKDDLKI